MDSDRVLNSAAETELATIELSKSFVLASKAVSYGLDTASRVYGLDMVLAAVQNVDEMGRDAKNPLEAIYERLAPTEEAQQDLYREMRRDLEKPQRAAFVLPAAENTLRVGRNARGEFFEKNPENGWPEQNHEASIQMIRALKKITRALDINPCFTEIREGAQAAGLAPLEYLVREEINPTLSFFLKQASEAVGFEIEELSKLVEAAKKDIDESEPIELEKIEVTDMEEPENVDNFNNMEDIDNLNEIETTEDAVAAWEEAELGEICDLDESEDEIQEIARGVARTQGTAQNMMEDLMEPKWLEAETSNQAETDEDDDIDVDKWFEETMTGKAKIRG